MGKLCVIKIRSSLKKSGGVQTVIKNLGLNKLYSCVLIDDTPANIGMLKVADNILTYGEIDKEMLKKLLVKRAMTSIRKKYTVQNSEYEIVADKLMSSTAKLADMGIRRVFHLHPPYGGFERNGKKTPFSLKGVFGYRGTEINKLLVRMA
jgi:large subunit ribosomal protein L30